MSKGEIFTGCCVCIILPTAIFTVIALFTNLPSAPKCYIEELYVPALDLSLERTTNFNSSNATTMTNPSLFFDLAMRNGMRDYYALYNNIKLRFSYGKKQIASYAIQGFLQDKKDTAYRRQVVETRGVPWADALGAVSNGSTVVFRVDLVAKADMLYFDDGGTYKKHKGMTIGADVEVDGSGMKAQNGHIRLVNSGAWIPRVRVSPLLVLLLMWSIFLR